METKVSNLHTLNHVHTIIRDIITQKLLSTKIFKHIDYLVECGYERDTAMVMAFEQLNKQARYIADDFIKGDLTWEELK
jgi:hypothetical protein